MSFSRRKRIFDLVLTLLACVVLWPLLLGVGLAVWLCDGRPVFHGGERMQSPTRAFTLWKFRTMVPEEGDLGVTGGDKTNRVTPLGRRLRRARLDELPQLWNLLRGDISIVGPRPPLRHYVEAYPALYAEVLRCRPGLTGLATVAFRRREARLLAHCRTAEETEAVYCRRCIPTKARLDLLYAARQSLWLDLALILRTFGRE